jgi:hypothetical protein
MLLKLNPRITNDFEQDNVASEALPGNENSKFRREITREGNFGLSRAGNPHDGVFLSQTSIGRASHPKCCKECIED